MELIDWRFIDQLSPQQSTISLLASLQRLISETHYESPFIRTLDALMHRQNVTTNQTKDNLFVYTFHIDRSMDIRGSVNFFGGASHTSDLLFLMGPSLFQQVGRRRLTQNELQLCKRIQQMFVNFIKFGEPTPGRIFDKWHSYSNQHKFIQVIGNTNTLQTHSKQLMSEFERNSVEINALIQRKAQIVSTIENPYQFAVKNLQENNIDDNDSIQSNSRLSKSYLSAPEAYEYINSLNKIDGFWRELLPKFDLKSQLTKRVTSHTLHNGNDGTNDIDAIDGDNDYDDLLIAGAAAVYGSKFKHAFFSMLILVCLLLGVLCVCLYILKKNEHNIDTSYL